MIRVIAIIAAVLALSFLAMAQAPAPEHTAGWGLNNVTFALPEQEGNFSSGELLWFPTGNATGHFNVAGTPTPVVWPQLAIEVWVELECAFSWDQTEYDVHLVSFYQPFDLCFTGHSSCNSPVQFFMTNLNGVDLFNLPLQGDVPDGDVDFPAHIPITWTYSTAYIPSSPLIPTVGFPVALCDQTFQICAHLTPVYHQLDGYYAWTATPDAPTGIELAFGYNDDYFPIPPQ